MSFKKSVRVVAVVIGLSTSWSADAADCAVATLDAGQIAGLYQVGSQRLGRLFNLSQTLKGDDALLALQAQGPLASFSDASYLIADLLKLRSGMASDGDRDVVDRDIRANLDLAGAAFYSAADYLGAIAPKVHNTDLKSAIALAQQFVTEGIGAFGTCVKAPAH